MRQHPRLVALVAALAVAFVIFAVAAGRSRGGSGGCSAPPPVPALPAALRSLGDFDQPYPADQPRALSEAAVRAAAALHGDLGGQSLVVGDAVHLEPGPGTPYPALVIPLGTNVAAGGGAPRTIEALVAFRVDCSGQVWYADVADLAGAPPAAFPEVERTAAGRMLGVDPRALHLQVRDSPFTPVWADPGSGRTLAAQPPAPPLAGIPTPAPAAG